MGSYTEELRHSQTAWKICTLCGYSAHVKHGGRANMKKHFETQHGDEKRGAKKEVQ